MDSRDVRDEDVVCGETMEKIGVAVIGGGAVGCAVAMELARAQMRDVFVLERRAGVGEVQSGRNSGVVHAGIYYMPGSLKAELCVASNALMFEFCAAHGVAVERVGKLVVASRDEQIPELEKLFALSQANGVQGVAMLDRGGVRGLEPNIDVPAALHVPTTGIVDAAGLMKALALAAEKAGAGILTSFDVVHIEPGKNGFIITGRRGRDEEMFTAEVVVNAAGLHCDTLARMINPEIDIQVVPLRGEYCRINRRSRPRLWLNGFNVYPTPEKIVVNGRESNMVGVHLTPTFTMSRGGEISVGDIVTVGPKFVVASDREDYERGRHMPELFLSEARRFFPSLELDDLCLDFSGIMVHVAGQSDFIIRRDERWSDCVQLLGIDSPGLTSSLAIARRVRKLLLG